MSVLLVVGLLATGGFVTSFAEYKLQYNLIDLIVEKIKSIFGVAKADVNAAVSEVKKKL